eukprot:9183320-Pyramimonas_sp.AAC.1
MHVLHLHRRPNIDNLLSAIITEGERNVVCNWIGAERRTCTHISRQYSLTTRRGREQISPRSCLPRKTDHLRRGSCRRTDAESRRDCAGVFK